MVKKKVNLSTLLYMNIETKGNRSIHLIILYFIILITVKLFSVKKKENDKIRS